MTSFDIAMKNLPPYIGKEIFSFIIGDSGNITFQRDVKSDGQPRELAFVGDNLVKNKKSEYLSRIVKKNGKHRYYLTTKHEIYTCDGCGNVGCSSTYCRQGITYEFWFLSKYVGKDVNKAILDLYLEM